MRKISLHRAFTLVEMAIAMGISSFALVSMLGVFSVGISTGKTSLNQTVIAEASRQVINSLQQQTLNSGALYNALEQTGTNFSTIGDIYFDVNGTRLQDASGADIAKADALKRQGVYHCSINAKVDPQLANLWTVKLTFEWPIQAENPPNSTIILTNIAKYY